ncbi:cell division protein ZipA [Kangiella sp. TOML190]|uniref:cell division protein ZipA n=1 Tax=Kangiella sp. TOML190 TaxID=2931351 RepID=UPI00203B654A|nr:cell division protein ZipA [Kangiella sp. TOML190]
MDYTLTILLIIVGVIIIGFIYFDAKRRQRLRQEKRDQKLFEQSLDAGKDNSGYDIDGIGEVRLVESAQAKVRNEQPQEVAEVATQTAVASTKTNTVKTEAVAATHEHLEPKFGDEEQAVKAVQKSSAEEPPVLDDMLFGFDKEKLNDKENTKQEPKVAKPTQPSLFEEDKEPQLQTEPELIFTLYLVSPTDSPYQGEQLVQTLLEQGMRHGDMDIFHRHSQATGRGPVQFSLASAYEPGSFDLDQLDQLETKGLAVFMALPGPKKPMKAYELMIKTCRAIVEDLGGYIIDSSKAHFSKQIEAHHKEQIQEFERKLLLKQH